MIVVLRLGHRLGRDARISTHVGLVARAFGADSIIYSGQKDEKMLQTVRKVVDNFGGPFDVSYEKSWKKILEDHRKRGFKIVHLTMYGKSHREMEARGDLLIVIGGEKVPPEIYHMADFNISVTNQPHSEVSALGVFLDKLLIEKEFKDAKLSVKTSSRGKIVERKSI